MCVCVCVCVCVCERERERERARAREKESEREGGQNSELYYSKTEILGICLFLQSVLANLHANTYTTTIRTLTTIIIMKMAMIIYW